eukprot:1160310-Pelagomonas_calceolata.AAC.4
MHDVILHAQAYTQSCFQAQQRLKGVKRAGGGALDRAEHAEQQRPKRGTKHTDGCTSPWKWRGFLVFRAVNELLDSYSEGLD